MRRIGYVEYLNTVPLIEDLEQLLPADTLLSMPPSELAIQLENGDLDVALAPVVSSFHHPEYQIVSDSCIACAGRVCSVTVYSKVPVDQIKTLRLEPQSRTSNALIQILLKEMQIAKPQYIRPEPDPFGAPIPPETLSEDAVLAIGNRALRMAGIYPYSLDLGEAWLSLTGLPFVFAAWFARPEFEVKDVSSALSTARDRGVQRLNSLAEDAARRLDFPLQMCRDYLMNCIGFHLTPEARQGLNLFRQKYQLLIG